MQAFYILARLRGRLQDIPINHYFSCITTHIPVTAVMIGIYKKLYIASLVCEIVAYQLN